MEVRVDRTRCVGSGLCMMHVPAVFDQSEDDGKVLLTTAHPGPALARSVRAAAGRCPGRAISLHDGAGREGSDGAAGAERADWTTGSGSVA
ncbi:ferredoxin [Streptomyces sp. CMB-StM0423]|uniref:ferredoxin n=1 Tax=Streptomyces sp. CMB-StM0423 TaxID=2059884 RepID=UPI001F20A5CE|nr:ferredoxin [Streptomyces sp. CMB-StM0423]